MTEFERGRAAGMAEAMEVVEKPLVTLRFPGQKPRQHVCRLCQWPSEFMPWQQDPEQPFICKWCEQRTETCSGAPQPKRNDPIWHTTFGHHYRRAIAAWRTLDTELGRIIYQRSTGKMGSHIRWKSMTREQRKAWEEQPAPSRALMP